MSELTSQGWFWPALIVVIGLPVVLLILTELNAFLVRRNSNFATPVQLLRNYVAPMLALLLLVSQVEDASVEATWTRIVATVFGFLTILLVLSGANAVLFGNAAPGTWRDRLPSIFVDLGRLLLIAVGLAVLFSIVWGADVGGLFAALGVTSIVIGLALQSAVGPVIAGLFLLFEQPFRLGDWLQTASASGRIVEVNWRAVHIDTGNGLQIVPNAMLASSSFTNLSRATGASYTATVVLTFSPQDPPDRVISALLRTAADLPGRVQSAPPRVVPLVEAQYRVSVAVPTPADEGGVKAALLQRVWYRAQREGLHLDGAESVPSDELATDRVALFASALSVSTETAERLAPRIGVLRYGAGETLQYPGEVPSALLLVVSGRIALFVPDGAGDRIPLGELAAGDYLGLTALTRQKVISGAAAADESTLLSVPRDVMEELVRAHPDLARRLGDAIEARRAKAGSVIAGSVS